MESLAGRDVIIGLDVGGTKTAVVIGTPEGDILSRTTFATRTERGVEAVFAELLTHLDKALHKAADEGWRVLAVSVSIGGPLDIERGIIYSPPNLPGWDAFPLKERLMAHVDLPVFVEHDGNTGALAEWRFGAGRGVQSMIFITMGTGFGAGIILDGRLYRGASDMAGEIGHLRLAPDGPVGFGKAGSWEGFCAGPAIGRAARAHKPGEWGEITTPEVTRLALAGDPDAVQVVTEIGERLGQGLALLVDILNPQRIVIGSMAVRLGDLVLEPARRIIRQEALPRSVAVFELVPAQLGEKLGDIASLCAAIQGLGL